MQAMRKEGKKAMLFTVRVIGCYRFVARLPYNVVHEL
ncbi:hypothetical protein FHS92_000654 [Sphingobium subterraneum]|uniref:Uncharacterized protein n=1 Tax=Sphingobium subterraneum TaxID=627688 RepID=A0A841IWD4_9SPHN|nr:hypothetical protein [Sphingobium subterraneum]